MKNCSFNGEVSGNKNAVGGLVGQLVRGGEINSCYFNGAVSTDTECCGGIVGHISDQSVVCQSTITNCYATGNINIKGNLSGGIIGNISQNKNESVYTFTNNYFLNTMAETGYPNGTAECIRLSSKILKSADELLGSPFVANTDDSVNDGYPVFEWQATPYQFKGSGTENDPYQISSKEELKIMRDLVNSKHFDSYAKAWYIQTADIDLENEVFEPIGTRNAHGIDLDAPLFLGNYDGNYHKIINLNVDKKYAYAGLFGSLRGNHAIENLIVYGNVKGAARCVGGICGEIVHGGGIIRNCAFIGNVTGNGDCIGGIVGVIYQNGIIENCYHIGNVTNSGIRTGGLVGCIDVGRMYENGKGILRNSYHAGTVSGQNNETTGAVVGSMYDDKKYASEMYVSNCYYLKDDAPVATNGETSKCDAVMLPSNLLKLIAEDLGTPFTKNSDETLNNGYPVFYWQTALTGDINQDGTVTVNDAVLMQKYLHSKQKFTKEQYTNADINRDGKVNVYDMILMKRKLLEKK